MMIHAYVDFESLGEEEWEIKAGFFPDGIPESTSLIILASSKREDIYCNVVFNISYFSGTNKLQKLEDALGRNRGDTTHGWHGTGDTEDTSDRGDRGDNGDKGDSGDSEDRGDKGQIFPTIANIV